MSTETTTTETPTAKATGKRFNTQRNIGHAKYVVNFHDGIKKHNDGSDFFDIRIFKNQQAFNHFQKELKLKGYTEC